MKQYWHGKLMEHRWHGPWIMKRSNGFRYGLCLLHGWHHVIEEEE